MTEVPIGPNPLIYYAIQWTGFYMIGTSVIKELRVKKVLLETCKAINDEVMGKE